MKLGKLDNETLDRLILQKFKKTREESFDKPRIACREHRLDIAHGTDIHNAYRPIGDHYELFVAYLSFMDS